MKKIILSMFVFILAMSLVLAVGPQAGIHEPGTGLENPELKEAAQGTGQGLLLGERVQAGDYISESGKELQIRDENGIRLRTRDVEAHSLLNITQEKVQNRTRLNVALSNGRNAEIKIMPDTASETALTRLRLRVCNESNNCTIQLKEVGMGNQTRAAYEMQIERHSRILGIFAKKMQVQTQVDAENGEVIQTRKPWWAFLASEPAETE